jgi:hypothetical protein
VTFLLYIFNSGMIRVANALLSFFLPLQSRLALSQQFRIDDLPYDLSSSSMQPGVGNIAINDAFMLEGAIYFLLKKHFRGETYYVDLLELFHDVSRGWALTLKGRRGGFERRKGWEADIRAMRIGHFPN